MFTRLLLVCLVVGCAKVKLEDAEIQKAAKAQAERIQSALVEGDLGTVADLTHPKVVAGMGGREKMLATLGAGLEEMKEGGITFKDVRILDPSRPVRVGKEIYIVVPFDMESTTPDGPVKTRASVVGVSNDGGKTWGFVDTAPGRAALKQVFPELPDSLDIPE